LESDFGWTKRGGAFMSDYRWTKGGGAFMQIKFECWPSGVVVSVWSLEEQWNISYSVANSTGR